MSVISYWIVHCHSIRLPVPGAAGRGYLIAGQGFDRTSAYNPAYAMFFVFDIVAAVLIGSIPKSKPATSGRII
jgi:hypothetical protein